MINTYSFSLGANIIEDYTSEFFDINSFIIGIQQYINNKDLPFDFEKWVKLNEQFNTILESEQDTHIGFDKIEFSKLTGVYNAINYTIMGLDLNLIIVGYNQKLLNTGFKITLEQDKIEEKINEILIENKKAYNKKILLDNAKNKNVTSLPSGLQYKILKEGSGSLIDENDTLKINYTASSIEGYEFINTFKSGAHFQVTPNSNLIKGWQEILKLMKKGSKFQVFIPDHLAYGKRCISQYISSFSTIVFEIEILEITKNKNNKSSLKFSDADTETIGKYGIIGPVIKKIIKGEKSDVIENADVLYFWDGNSKFGNILFKHNNRWYSAGGFVGGDISFFKDEVKMNGGLVVFVTDSSEPFGKTKYGATISAGIESLSKIPCIFNFAYYSSIKFGAYPKYRDYYDEDNKKIIYEDY